VNLTAFAGLQSIGLSQLFQASTDRGAGPALTAGVQPRRAAQHTAEPAGAARPLVGEYNQTLLDAVREVADVIANWRSLERESHEQQIALEAAQRSYELTTERYRAGLDNYLSVCRARTRCCRHRLWARSCRRDACPSASTWCARSAAATPALIGHLKYGRSRHHRPLTARLRQRRRPGSSA